MHSWEEGKRNVMAKGQYHKWLKPENLVRLRGWKMSGLTDGQIAKNIGVSRWTLENWKSKFPNISHMLRVGKESANFIVENALFKKAVKGNTACIIFWLKNNFSRKYSDTQDSYMESKLKHEQIKKIRAETKKSNAEAKIKSQQAKQNDTSENRVITQTDKLLDKMEKYGKEHKK